MTPLGIGRAAIASLSALIVATLGIASCDAGASTRQPIPGTIESQRVSPAPVTTAPPAPAPTPTPLREGW